MRRIFHIVRHFSSFSTYLTVIASEGGRRYSQELVNIYGLMLRINEIINHICCCVASMSRQQCKRFVNCALLAEDKERIRRINHDTDSAATSIHYKRCHCSPRIRYLLSLVFEIYCQIIISTE